MFLNRFDIQILKIIFFYKYYFNIFPNRKHLKNNLYYNPNQTLSMERIAKAGDI
jgi:hypothetical protein